MNTKNWLVFFFGGIAATVTGLIIYLLAGKNVQIKDILPSLITGVVTFAALLFTYLNNEKQREIQFKTTIEKEWIENVRHNILTLLDNLNLVTKYMSISRSRHLSTSENNELISAQMKANTTEALLRLYLDSSRPLEKKLILDIADLNVKSSRIQAPIEVVAAIGSINGIIEDAHKIFESRLAMKN